MNRDIFSKRNETLNNLCMKMGDWPENSSLKFVGSFLEEWKWFDETHGEILINLQNGLQITREHWKDRRQELINCPPDSEAPDNAEWKCQDGDGGWTWFESKPYADYDVDEWLKEDEDSIGLIMSSRMGNIPAGHRWQDTLTRINRDDNTSTPKEEAEFDRIQARQDAGKPHEADARMLDVQLSDAIQFGKITPNANSILNAAAQHLQVRAATYDKPEGERSMGATVDAFRATTGIELTEEQGWHFMALLKLVRSQQGDYRADSYEDGAAYVALAGEAAAKRRAK